LTDSGPWNSNIKEYAKLKLSAMLKIHAYLCAENQSMAGFFLKPAIKATGHKTAFNFIKS